MTNHLFQAGGKDQYNLWAILEKIPLTIADSDKIYALAQRLPGDSAGINVPRHLWRGSLLNVW